MFFSSHLRLYYFLCQILLVLCHLLLVFVTCFLVVTSDLTLNSIDAMFSLVSHSFTRLFLFFFTTSNVQNGNASKSVSFSFHMNIYRTGQYGTLKHTCNICLFKTFLQLTAGSPETSYLNHSMRLKLS